MVKTKASTKQFKKQQEQQQLRQIFQPLPYDIQRRIVLFNKFNEDIEKLKSENERLKLQNTRDTLTIEHLRLQLDMMDSERIFLRRANHSSYLENLRLRRKLRNVKSILAIEMESICQTLNFSQVDETSDESDSS